MERYKTFKTEAQPMYQSYLERKPRECQAELIKAQDQVVVSESAIEKAKWEVLAWRQEAMRAKNALNLHEFKLNEHPSADNEDMMNMIKASCTEGDAQAQTHFW